jgi:hypothetical protein
MMTELKRKSMCTYDSMFTPSPYGMLLATSMTSLADKQATDKMA